MAQGPSPLDQKIEDVTGSVAETLEEYGLDVSREIKASELENVYREGAAKYERVGPENLPGPALLTFCQDREDPVEYLVKNQCEEGESVMLGEIVIEGELGALFDPNLVGSVKYKAENRNDEVFRYLEMDSWHADSDIAETNNEIRRIESYLQEETSYETIDTTDQLKPQTPGEAPSLEPEEVEGANWGSIKGMAAAD